MTQKDILNQLNLVISYKQVTKKLGPSEQLLAFINFDGRLGEEIGLEGFENLSLEARHEIILSKLDERSLFIKASEGAVKQIDIALESLVTELLISTTIMSVLLGITWGGIKITSIVAGKITKKIGDKFKAGAAKNAAVLPYSSFDYIKKAFDAALKSDEINTRDIPGDFDIHKWDDYSSLYDYAGSREGSGNYESLFDTYIDYKNKFEKSHRSLFEKSGWDVNNYTNSVKWFVDSSKKLNNSLAKYKNTLEKIQKWLRDHEYIDNDDDKWDPEETDENGEYTKYAILCQLYWAIDRSVHGFHSSISVLKSAEKELKLLSTHFEEVR